MKYKIRKNLLIEGPYNEEGGGEGLERLWGLIATEGVAALRKVLEPHGFTVGEGDTKVEILERKNGKKYCQKTGCGKVAAKGKDRCRTCAKTTPNLTLVS